MPRKTKSLKSYTYHSVNPFLKEFKEDFACKNKIKKIGVTTQEVLNNTTGEIESQKLVVLGRKETVDSEEFAKLYIKNIGFFYELSKSDLKIFQYLLQKVKYNEDIVCVNIPKIAHDNEISIQTVYNSLAVLIDRHIIAKANTNECYYVNPKVFFKGDRLILITEYNKSKETKKLK